MAQSKRLLLYFLPLTVFVGLTVLLWQGIGKDPTLLESQVIGRPLPKFSLPDLLTPDRQITDNDIKGPALINLWASWCPACYHEHPFVTRLAKEENIPVWGLNFQDNRKDALTYLREQGNPYRGVIFDEKGRLGIDLGAYGAPETYVIGREGTILYRHVGVLDQQTWDTKIRPLLDADTGEQQ